MIKLCEPVVGIIFFEINLFNPYNICAVYVSDAGKQPLTVIQCIYQLSDKDHSVPDDIDLWLSVWTRLSVQYLLPYQKNHHR